MGAQDRSNRDELIALIQLEGEKPVCDPRVVARSQYLTFAFSFHWPRMSRPESDASKEIGQVWRNSARGLYFDDREVTIRWVPRM